MPVGKFRSGTSTITVVVIDSCAPPPRFALNQVRALVHVLHGFSTRLCFRFPDIIQEPLNLIIHSLDKLLIGSAEVRSLPRVPRATPPMPE